jgi:hypothetical protein
MDPTRAAAAAQLIAQDARTGALLWRQLDANPLGGMQTLYALEQASRGTGRAMLAELSGGSTRRWRQLELQLRYIPAALEQAQTYYVAARLGWIPPARERSWLWERRWQQQVGHLRGPRTIVAMLKWLATWPDHSALLDLVERVRWPAVARRINRGLGPDLEQLPELLGAMQTLRRMDLVLSLPEELSAEGLDRLSTDPLARLTRGLASVAALSPLVRDAAQRRLGHMARARTVLAPEAHFGAMGRLAHALRASGTASVATPVAPLRGRRPDVLTAAWGVTWMADSSWRSQILDEASAALAERQPRTPWATGAMELVGNALGWTRTHDTSRVWDASAAMLRDVLSLASGDESLRLRLDVHGEPADVAYDQLRDPAFALEPDALSAAELIESLRARAAALA